MATETREPLKDNFHTFTSFMAHNKTFMIPLDSSEFKNGIITSELLSHVIHGNQREVLRYDFSALEEEGDRLFNTVEQLSMIKQDQHNEHNFVTETERKKRAYQYYHPNRDFGDDLEALTLKKVDNGEFWNNGYR